MESVQRCVARTFIILSKIKNIFLRTKLPFLFVVLKFFSYLCVKQIKEPDMRTNNNLFLPQYTLDQISLQVCSKLSMFNNTSWEGVQELCVKIEEEPRAVASVIIGTKKKFTNNITSNIKSCHQVLTCVYMLLYYRHRDDNIYKVVVFPELVENMGVYATAPLNDIIQPLLDKIRDLDQLVKKAKSDEKRNVKPKYQLIKLNTGEADVLYSEFNKEELFRQLCVPLENIRKENVRGFDVSALWLTAKDVVRKLWKESFPENFIDRVLDHLALSGNTGYVENGAAETVMMCVYVMMHSVQSSTHFSKAIAYFENMEEQRYYLLCREVATLKKMIDNGSLIFDDYDYVGDKLNPENEMFTKAELERALSDYKTKIEALENELAQKNNLMEQLTESSVGEIEDRKENEKVLYNKVRYEFFLKLLEKSGFDVKKANKTQIGELWKMFTGKEGGEIRKFSSNRRYNNNHTKKDIMKLNEQLSSMGITEIKL